MHKLWKRYAEEGMVVRGVKHPSLIEKEKDCLLSGIKEISPALNSILLCIEGGEMCIYALPKALNVPVIPIPCLFPDQINARNAAFLMEKT